MKSTKGFTLVELLAVIVILAIIALITIPAILNVINDAREKGAQDKAWGVLDAVRLAYTQNQGWGNSNITATEGELEVCFGTSKTESCKDEIDGQTINMSGDAPSSGKVIIDLSTGKLSCQNLYFNKNGAYYCNSDGTDMNCTTTPVEINNGD